MSDHLPLRFFATLLLGAALSCGSSSSSLFDQTSGGSSSSKGGESNSPSTGGGAGAISTGGSDPTGEGGSAGAEETGGDDGGGGEPSEAAEDASAPVEGTGTIVCGNTTCDVTNGGHCCVGQQGPMPSTATCQASDAQSCQMGLITLACDGAEDCQSDEVCCAGWTQLGPMSNLSGVSCKAPSSCTGNSLAVVCNPAASDACPLGGTCQTDSSMPDGYMLCR